jgi:acylphosphatase
MEAIRYIVRGRVQGVGFRDFARRAARQAGLTGWVRNRGDGAVEAMAVGSSEALAAFAAALAEGPRRSQVESVESEPLGEQPAPARFDITW